MSRPRTIFPADFTLFQELSGAEEVLWEEPLDFPAEAEEDVCGVAEEQPVNETANAAVSNRLKIFFMVIHPLSICFLI